MIAPLGWLKEYIDITVKPEKLGERLTEVGLGTEHIRKEKNDVIFDLEITPNRPDLLSIIGVAREIAAIESKKITYPKLKTDLKPPKNGNILPLKIHPNYTITPRLTGIIINNVTVKESPDWLKKRLESIGQRPINNIVDITNFVMWELGNPIHAFDYHKIEGAEMWVKQAKGGEEFESVDKILYHLPKDAIIYEDKKKIFDLVGIKGGKNSGTYEHTKAVFIVVEVDDPTLIRKTSQKLGLRSEASSIFERGVNKGGTIDALKRTVDLIQEVAGGEIASSLIDLHEKNFEPWEVILRQSRLGKILGITIPEKEVVKILNQLNLSPKVKGDTITLTIPTYRNDLQLEEDIIEEVARLYGYNRFPKTLPHGEIPTKQIPYFKDYRIDEKAKNFFLACGFSEIYTYSLISEKDLEQAGVHMNEVLRVDNPVSRDFEYLRPTLKINLLKALKQNQANFSTINLFELGKIYMGKNLNHAKETCYLSGISNKKSFYEIKGILELFFLQMGITANPVDYIYLLHDSVFFEIPYEELLQKQKKQKAFIPLPKYPPVIEDITLIIGEKTTTGELLLEIQKQNTLISSVTLLDQYQDTRTFHIVYQDREKNLTTKDIEPIRIKILSHLEKKYHAKIK